MGWGEEGTENYYLIGVGFFVKNYKKKKVLEMDGGEVAQLSA